ncbi:dihydrofolate reductase family protein [Actinokineospora guangxiensis]|uniref:Dihydrofolate reductase family protein n=1 Tax=Actinokineospora guangxiensis TaxID=1490288 RepID=A0ABW0EQW9_9PSEU
MRRLIHFVHSSADGFIEGPNGEFDWPVMEQDLSDYSIDLTGRAEVFLYGRVVWEMMAGYWPEVESLSEHPHDLAFAPIWRSTPKAVLSRTLVEAGHGARVVAGDLTDQVTELKAGGDGAVLLFGGSSAAGALSALGLIDEYRVVVHPVLLGGGKPVFAPGARRAGLRLVETRAFDGGSVLLHYTA